MAPCNLTLGEEEHELGVEEQAGPLRGTLDGEPYAIQLPPKGRGPGCPIPSDDKPDDVFAEEGPNAVHIVIGSRSFAITTPGPRRGRRAEGAPADLDADIEGEEWVLTSPMAGVVQDVMVGPGDEVEKGHVVMVIEAMKMQNDLHKPRAGPVKAVYVSIGERVEQGTKLLVVL